MISRRLTTGLILGLYAVSTIFGPIAPLTSAQNTCLFNDVCDTSDSAYSAIKALKEQGIIKGNPDGSFRPEAIVNRAEILTMLFRAAPNTPAYDKAYGFPDVPATAWYAPYVSTAKKLQFVQGYPDGTFRGGDGVKSEEAAKLAIAFLKTPLPEVRKGYNGQGNNENALQYGIKENEWYTPYLKTVHDFKLLDYVSLAEGMNRRDVAILLYRAQNATKAMQDPVQYLSAWNEPGSALLQQGSVYNAFLYFSKPLDLSSLKNNLRITGDGGRVISGVTVYAHAWGFDNDRISGLANYAFRPHEIKLSMTGINDRENITITIKAGTKDIYGGNLAADVKLLYKTATNPMSIALGGSSYLRYGDTLEASVLLEGSQDPVYARTTGYLCHISADVAVKEAKRTTVSTETGQMQIEYLPLKVQMSPAEALKPYCASPKTANLTGLSTNNVAKDFDIEKTFGEKLTPGVYFLGIHSQGTSDIMGASASLAHRLVYVADTALTLKSTKTSPMEGAVWATSMNGNGAQAGLNITVYAVENTEEKNVWRKVSSGTTDAQGIYRFRMQGELTWSEELIAVAEGANHFGLVGSSWDSGLEPYNYGLSMAWGNAWGEVKGNRVFMHTDRKIYRPGHEVGLRGIVRTKEANGYSVPAKLQLTAAIYDSQYKLVSSFPVESSDQGTFSGSMVLPAMAALGEYNVILTDSTPSQEFTYDQPIQTTFEVEEYVRPDFRVTMDNAKTDYITGENLSLQGKADYYFGLPVANGTYSWELTRESLYFNPSSSGEWFSFSDSAYCYYYCDGGNGFMASGEGKLSSDGTFSINSPLALDDTGTGGLYTLRVEASDQNNRVVTAEKVVRVHKADAYVGLRNTAYMAKEGSTMNFDVVTMTPSGAVLPGKTVTVELVQEDWSNFAKQDVSGDMMSYNDKIDRVIATKTLTTGSDGRGVVQFPAGSPGQYFARATVTDAKGNTNRAREYGYVYPKDDNGYISWASDDVYKAQMLLDKPEYKPGDEAQIVLTSPYPKATALVSVERGSVLDTYSFDLTSNAMPVKIPVKSSYIPSVYVSAVIMPKEGAQGLKVAYGTMMVDKAEKELTISLSTDKQKYLPGDEVNVSISTTNNRGLGVPAEVSLAVVDESIIALAGGVDRDIMRAFYAMESLAVWTASSLTHYVERGLVRSVGGSGKGGPSGMPFLRGLLKDTAYWNPSIQTDSNGKGTIRFVLPDNLTRWELLSIGVTKDTLVGSGSLSIDTKQDLIIQPILPRFVREGDQVTLTYTLFNLTDKADTVRMTLSSPNIALTKNIAVENVPAKGSATVSWQTTIPAGTENIELLAEAKGTTMQDKLISKLPVELSASFDATGVSGYSTTGSVSVTPSLAQNAQIRRDISTLSVQVSTGLLGSILPSLSYLVQYPYGCAEQTTSVMVGNVLLAGFMQKTKITLPGVDAKTIENNVVASLTRLYQYQSDGGGFALWGGNENVDPYLSSYVLDGMKLAMDSGFTVDTNRMRKLRTYLEGQLSSGKVSNANTRASMLLILQDTGSTGLESYAETLYQKRTSLSVQAASALLQFYAKAGTQSAKDRGATMLKELKANLVSEGGKVQLKNAGEQDGYFYFDTTIMHAAALDALVAMDPKDSLIPGLVATLLSSRSEGMWASTHSNALTLRSINRLIAKESLSSGAQTVKATIAGKEYSLNFPEGSLSPMQEIRIPVRELTGNAFPVSLSNTAGGTLYYDASISYALLDSGQQQSTTDYQVIRELFVKNGENLSPLRGTLRVGDTVVIRLSLRTNTGGVVSGKHVAKEDLIPAGLQLLNPNIRTEGGQVNTDEGWVNFYELRDDRSFVYLDSARPTVVSVEARAIAPGTFAYPAAKAFEMYQPLHYARTTPSSITITR